MRFAFLSMLYEAKWFDSVSLTYSLKGNKFNLTDQTQTLGYKAIYSCPPLRTRQVFEIQKENLNRKTENRCSRQTSHGEASMFELA